jgi:CO dehydrogenase maturation factor
MQTIVTAGKGGTGKSMILAHLLQRHILGNGFGKVLVVDADPHQSLSLLLGIESQVNLGAVWRGNEQTLKTGQGLNGLSRREFTRKLVQETLVPIEGADLLIMGHSKEPGCQCVVNTLLGSALDAIAQEYNLVVVDNEAGIEPLGRHLWPVDYLLLTSSPRQLEIDVARQILMRGKEVGRKIGFTGLLYNRFHPRQFFDPVYLPGTAVLGMLPYSEQLEIEEKPDEAWLEALARAWENLHGILLEKQRKTGQLGGTGGLR